MKPLHLFLFLVLLSGCNPIFGMELNELVSQAHLFSTDSDCLIKIIAYCYWQSKQQLPFVNKQFSNTFKTNLKDIIAHEPCELSQIGHLQLMIHCAKKYDLLAMLQLIHKAHHYNNSDTLKIFSCIKPKQFPCNAATIWEEKKTYEKIETCITQYKQTKRNTALKEILPWFTKVYKLDNETKNHYTMHYWREKPLDNTHAHLQNEKMTPLHIAATRKHIPLVKIIALHYPEQLNTQDFFKKTPLMHLSVGEPEVCKFLLSLKNSHCIIPDQKNKPTHSLLCNACSTGNENMVQLLLSHKDYSPTGENYSEIINKSQLLFAAIEGTPHPPAWNIIELLLAHGFNPKVEKNGKTAFQTIIELSRNNNHDLSNCPHIVNLLKKHG
jgi:hypothetical protein